MSEQVNHATSTAIENAASEPLVSVNTSLSSRDSIPWASEIHHFAISFTAPNVSTFNGTLDNLPGFGDLIAMFPAIQVVTFDIQFISIKAGSTLVAALSISGAQLTRASARHKKQRIMFGSNNFNVMLPQKGSFLAGDGMAKQIKPVSSTAVTPVFFFQVTGNADVTIDIYFQTSGPIDRGIEWGDDVIPHEADAPATEEAAE